VNTTRKISLRHIETPQFSDSSANCAKVNAHVPA
jgi:hypothetical protein